MRIHQLLRVLLVILLLTVVVLAVQAQDQPQPVTDDEVNEIAGKLYCPVCENIPLDTCPTAACADWRYEIRLQLEQGLGEQAIIDDFVTRFGDRVVGTPQDPLLRAISLVTPWLIIGAALLGGGWWILRFRAQSASRPAAEVPASPATASYYDQLEKDLKG